MNRLLKILSFGSIAVVVLALIVATLLESLYGSSFAIENFYHSKWFILMWALLAITAMMYILNTSRLTTLVMLHASFVVILLGALVSFITSRHGSIAIAHEGAPASMFTTPDGTLEKLPFRLQLTDLKTIYPENSETPADYVATVVVNDRKEQHTHTVSLNSPMKINGYRFCIKGVSEENLSLTVSHDIYGRPISYAGYFMVFLSFLLLFFDRHSGFGSTLQLLKGTREANSVIERKERSHPGNIVTRTTAALLCVIVPTGLLWYRRGTFPATNGAEALMLLASVIAAIAIALGNKYRFTSLKRTLAVAACISAAIALSGLEGEDEVQPILRTPLLGVHVTTIIIVQEIPKGEHSRRCLDACCSTLLQCYWQQVFSSGLFGPTFPGDDTGDGTPKRYGHW